MSTIRQDLDALNELHLRLKSDIRHPHNPKRTPFARWGYERTTRHVIAYNTLGSKIIRRFDRLESENRRLKIMYAMAKGQELLPCDCNFDPACKRCEGSGKFFMDLTGENCNDKS